MFKKYDLEGAPTVLAVYQPMILQYEFITHCEKIAQPTYPNPIKTSTLFHYFGPIASSTRPAAWEDGTLSFKTPCNSSAVKSHTPKYFSSAATTTSILCDLRFIPAVQLTAMATNTKSSDAFLSLDTSDLQHHGSPYSLQTQLFTQMLHIPWSHVLLHTSHIQESPSYTLLPHDHKLDI